MTAEELREEVARRYPPGTRYYELNTEGVKQKEIRTATDRVASTHTHGWFTGVYGYVYVKGTWAEIIEEASDATVDIMKTVKEKYVADVVFDNGNIPGKSNERVTITANPEFYTDSSGNILINRAYLSVQHDRTVYSNTHKVYAKILDTPKPKPDITAIKEEAKQRFPIGTKFNNKNLGYGNSNITVTGTNFYISGNSICINGDSTDEQSAWTVYKNGKWADIIPQTDLLLTKAKEVYTNGTVYESATQDAAVYTATGNVEYYGSHIVSGSGMGLLYNSETKQWANIITDKEANRRRLLQEAKDKYPVGTKFMCAHLSQDNTTNSYVSANDVMRWEGNAIIIGNGNQAKNGHSYTETVYSVKHERWATIIPNCDDELGVLLAEAIKRYPVGTKFYPTHVVEKSVRDTYPCEVTSSDVFKFINGKQYIGLSVGNKPKNGHGISEILYDVKEKKWAEIITDIPMTEKDRLLAEAEKNYPVGTSWIVPHMDNTHHIVTRVEGETFKWDDDYTLLMSYGNNKKNGHPFNEVVYFKGKGWGKKVPTKSVPPTYAPFKVGDIVDFTNDNAPGTGNFKAAGSFLKNLMIHKIDPGTTLDISLYTSSRSTSFWVPSKSLKLVSTAEEVQAVPDWMTLSTAEFVTDCGGEVTSSSIRRNPPGLEDEPVLMAPKQKKPKRLNNFN